MYIFERKNKHGSRLQCMESEYNKEKGRSENTMIASQDGHFNYVTDEVAEKLTEDQIKVFQDWLDARSKEETLWRDQSQIRNLRTKILMASAAIDRGIRFEDEDVEKSVDDVFEALDTLKRSLRKAGYKRPKKASNPVSKKDDRQADLISENAPQSV